MLDAGRWHQGKRDWGQNLTDLVKIPFHHRVLVPRTRFTRQRDQGTVIERMSKTPRGAFKGFVDSLKTDMIGDPTAIRAILPRPLLSFRQAVERALAVS